MPIEKIELESILRKTFPDSKIEITALVDDNDHYLVNIIDKSFDGKSKIEQHKMVNKALGNIVGNQLHAMQLKTSSN